MRSEDDASDAGGWCGRALDRGERIAWVVPLATGLVVLACAANYSKDLYGEILPPMFEVSLTVFFGLSLMSGAGPAYLSPRIAAPCVGFEAMLDALDDNDRRKVLLDLKPRVRPLWLVARLSMFNIVGMAFAWLATEGHWRGALLVTLGLNVEWWFVEIHWHTVHVAVQMCHYDIDNFVSSLSIKTWTQHLQRHRALDLRLENLFDGQLGLLVTAITARRLARGLAWVLMGLLCNGLATKAFCWTVGGLSLFSMTHNLQELADITERCNRTSPRSSETCIKAAVYRAAEEHMLQDARSPRGSSGTPELQIFLEYLKGTHTGVEITTPIGGVFVTSGLMLSLHARLLTFLPVVVGVLQQLKQRSDS